MKMKKHLALQSFNSNLFSKEDKFLVHTVANQFHDIFTNYKISKVVNIGNSFSWVSDYLKTSKHCDVSFFAYSGSSLTLDKSIGQMIDPIFDLKLYRKNVSLESISNLHTMFNNFGFTLKSLTTCKRMFIDMTKTGKGLRSFIFELELFIVNCDKRNRVENLRNFQANNYICVFQPSYCRDNNLKELFSKYNLILLNTDSIDEARLENFCDNDDVRLVPSNRIDENFKIVNQLNQTELSTSKHTFFNL